MFLEDIRTEATKYNASDSGKRAMTNFVTK